MISTVKKNVAANFLGNGWTALLAIILIPVYIKLLGVEAWGVIGIYAIFQNLAFLLDLGLSPMLNRELARLSSRPDSGVESRDLVRTVEIIYWGIAATVGVAVFALARLVAHHWVQASELSPRTIENALRLMGLALFFQCSFSLYSGGLMGLQRQVLLSGINIVVATARSVGAALIVWRVSRTLEAFFLWYVATGLIQTLVTRWFLWRRLPVEKTAPRFRVELLRKTWRFAAGMSAVTILSLVFTQMDKVILSRQLSLEMFGYYVLASSVATSLYLFTVPVFFALYPRFTQLVTLGDQEGLKEIYHDGCQLMSALIFPVAAVLAFFSKEILFLWTGSQTTAERTSLLLTILIIGTAFNAMLHLPNALQISYGWTRLIVLANFFAVLLSVPLIIFMASVYGAAGAAITFVCFTIAVTLSVVCLTHRRFLKGEQWRWYLKDVGWPLLVAQGAALLCRILVPIGVPRPQLLVMLVSVSLFVIMATVLATPVTRKALMSLVRTWQGQITKTS